MVSDASRPGGRWVALLAPLAVGIVAFLAARSAMLPGLAFWDTAELQAVGPLLGTAHPTGFPTYVLLGWLVDQVLMPFGEPAFRMNVFAGLSVAVAAAVTVDLVRTLTRSTALGVAAGLGLAFTPTVWALGTHAEAHALHLALIAVLLRLLVGWEAAHRTDRDAWDAAWTGSAVDDVPSRRTDRWLLAATVVFGLSVGNHSLTLLFALPIGLYVLAVEPGILRRRRFILTCVGVLVATMTVVFLELPLRAGPFRADLVYGRPETWEGFWSIVLGEQFRGSLMDPFGDLGGKAIALVDRTFAAFGPLALLIPGGLVATVLSRPRYALLTGAGLAITCFFAASYDNADIGRYYAGPILIAWTWLAILVAVVVDAFVPVRHETAARVGTVALAILLIVPTAVAIPSRHREVDRSAETEAATWVDLALDAVEDDAVIVSWWSYSTPLWYAQRVEGRRPDVAIIDDRTRLDEDLGDIYDVIDANLPQRPVYVIRADPLEVSGLAGRYELAPILGPDARFLTRVVGPREPGA